MCLDPIEYQTPHPKRKKHLTMLMLTARIEPRPPAQQASAVSITSIPTATDCAQLDN